MKKIIVSLSIVAVVAAIAVGATTSFFSDTETSHGNTFTAGAIDLKVDNTSYRSGEDGHTMVLSTSTSWGLTDLDDELFFNFADLKPGDLGEDTVSLHVDSNDAWLCADIDITANDDVTCTEPELDNDPTCSATSTLTGELARDLNFRFWADDGDNVLEVGENVLTSGPASSVLGGVTYALADSRHNIWTGSGPFEAGVPRYIGKAWCFGSIGEAHLPQDGVNTSGPDQRGPGVVCNGSLVDNAAQTDNLMGDISFRAVQARNNAGFVCVRPQL